MCRWCRQFRWTDVGDDDDDDGDDDGVDVEVDVEKMV
jgi:hypothetical protein